MTATAGDYEVSRPTGTCGASGRLLTPGEACIATLCEREGDDGLLRVDYSREAWDAGSRPDRLFSYWRTTVPEPDRKRRIFVDDELLRHLFERLADDPRPQRIAFRFVLGLVLMRKRLLRHIGRAEEAGVERWSFVWKGADPAQGPIKVINPRLSDEDARTVSDQLGEILNGELE